MNSKTKVLNVKNLRKTISMMIIVMMLLAMNAVPVFGTPGVLSMLTLPSEYFTIVDSANATGSITMLNGLDSTYAPVAIEGSKVSWTSSDPSVVSITGTSYTTDTATVNFKLEKEGRASITASYADSGVSAVSSNIVVERDSGRRYVAYDIDIYVSLKDAPAGYTIPNWLQNGIDVTDEIVFINDFTNYLTTPNILKMDPSAMTTVGTLRYLGEISSYVTISEGSYLESINGFGPYYDTSTYNYYGWQYRVRDQYGSIIPESITGSASILELENGYTVEWFWGSY